MRSEEGLDRFPSSLQPSVNDPSASRAEQLLTRLAGMASVNKIVAQPVTSNRRLAPGFVSVRKQNMCHITSFLRQSNPNLCPKRVNLLTRQSVWANFNPAIVAGDHWLQKKPGNSRISATRSTRRPHWRWAWSTVSSRLPNRRRLTCAGPSGASSIWRRSSTPGRARCWCYAISRSIPRAARRFFRGRVLARSPSAFTKGFPTCSGSSTARSPRTARVYRRPLVLPSAEDNSVGAPDFPISRLNGLPLGFPCQRFAHGLTVVAA